MTITAEQIDRIESGLGDLNISDPKVQEFAENLTRSETYQHFKCLLLAHLLCGNTQGCFGALAAAMHMGMDIGYVAAQSESLEKLVEDSR